MPVRHVVMLKFKDDASEAAKALVAPKLIALQQEIPEIKAIKAGPDAGLADGNHHFVATVDFESPLDYQTYAKVNGTQ